ncbi:uncharacterized protein [Haliotis asinina]|uniref:uncharacterized protein n=1 Tax=Haliotis asinina TaxID=109174 RepID=UPI00353182DA
MALTPSGSSRNEKKRRLEDLDLSTGNVCSNSDSWARFVVIESSDFLPIKLNPFAISKAISGICGEVKNVTRLRSGSLLVECARRQQSLNLLSIKTFANIEVVVSVHRTLNSCRGIIRDRARCLADMSEEEIASELADQGISSVKRFTIKKEGLIVKPNTYLLTFDRSSLPKSIKAGYFNIGVDVYVPSPLRCYNCQHFGHGSQSCRNQSVCHRCGDRHEGSDCEQEYKCANCNGPHSASSRSCPMYQRESQLMKIKCLNNISYLEAKKLLTPSTQTPPNLNYSAAVTRSVATSSVSCQTDVTWVTSNKPIPSTSALQSTPQVTHSTSASQTENHHEQQSETSVSKPVNDSSKQKKGKRLNRDKQSTVPSSHNVLTQNTFAPLDMEVTLSSQDTRRNNPSSHSRGLTPIKPP